MARVAFIGLGVMGAPMAGHLAEKGHDVSVFNRSPEKAQAWGARWRGRVARSPRQAADGADFVMTCLGNDDSVRAMLFGEDGALAGMAKGAILVDHTTASAELARDLDAAARDRGLGFVDGPVSGGQAGAENGALTVMCGGSQDAYDQAEPVIMAYARACRRLGDAGAGQLCKMVNQICIAGLVQALAEGAAFAQKAGLDGRAVFDVISKGAAGSWQMENRHEWMLDGAFEDDKGFALDWMRKDLDYALAEGRRIGAQLPVTALVDQFYADLQRAGRNRWDTSSLVERLKD